MKKEIEVVIPHWDCNRRKIVSTRHITSIEEIDDGHSRICMDDGREFEVEESYDTLKSTIYDKEI